MIKVIILVPGNRVVTRHFDSLYQRNKFINKCRRSKSVKILAYTP